MLDYFSRGRFYNSSKKKEKTTDETNKKCTAPFSGWGGPLQVPSKIMFTIGDFFGCLVCCAFILHIIILIGTHGTAQTSRNKPQNSEANSYTNSNPKKQRNKLKAIFNYVTHEITGRSNDNDEADDHYGAVAVSLFFMWIFGLNFANLAIIPIFIFTRFSYFSKSGGLFQPVLRAIYSPLAALEGNKYVRHVLGAFYLLYFVIFIIYAIAAFLGGTNWGFTGVDRMLLGVVVVIPVFRICVVLIAYAIHSWISFFYSVTCNRNRLIRLQRIKTMYSIPKLPMNQSTTSNNKNDANDTNEENEKGEDLNNNRDKSDDNQADELSTEYVFTSKQKNGALGKINKFIENNNKDKAPDHDNMNTIRSITFDGGFDSPFDYCPKFARADPFLYSIYGQSTLCTWHCTPDGKTNSWSASWELYHIIVAIATCIYIIYIASNAEECSGNCIGFVFAFILIIIPLTIRVRFPFFVIHSAFSCIPSIDNIFDCFGCCNKCLKKSDKDGCGCDCDCECQQCMSKTFNSCCNKGSENVGLNEIDDDFSMEEIYESSSGSEKGDLEQQPQSEKMEDIVEQDIDDDDVSVSHHARKVKQVVKRRKSDIEREKPAKVFKNFELLALSSKGLGVMSAVIYLIIIAVMLVVTVFIMSNFAFDNRVYNPYNLNLTKYNEGLNQKNVHKKHVIHKPTILEGIKHPISELCYARPFGLNMLQYFLLADLSYYDAFSETAQAAIDEFFDSGPTISNMGQMDLHQYNFGSMSYFNFDDLDLSVVSIRGSTEGVDWALDIQFFLSSALLTISAPLNIFTRDDTPRTMKSIRKILAYPLVLMEKFTLFYKFYDDLMSYYDTIPLKQNVVFVGHSLGGGLAKLFGHVKGKAAISVSGPGITLFQTIKKGARKDVFSLLSETDVVPDMDLVPRVEQSAATRYRILCNQGFGTCHFIKHTLCMSAIMCNDPHENFCRSFNDSSIPDIYNKMLEYAAETN